MTKDKRTKTLRLQNVNNRVLAAAITATDIWSGIEAARENTIRGKKMRIVRGTIDHVNQWARLRAALWPDGSVEQHREDIVETFLQGAVKTVAFLGEGEESEIIAFAEGSLRSDYVNGCKTSPVVFLEGIYVLPSHRQKGVARLLCHAIGIWGRSRGCSEFASDAPLENEVSRNFHAALGFAETQRVVFFRKDIEH